MGASRGGEDLPSHARRISAHATHPDLAAARALAKKLAGGDLADEFALRDVYRAGGSGLTTPEDAKGAVDLLVDLDWLREERRATGGWTATVHLINPGVFTHTPVGGTDRTDGRGGGGLRAVLSVPIQGVGRNSTVPMMTPMAARRCRHEPCSEIQCRRGAGDRVHRNSSPARLEASPGGTSCQATHGNDPR